MTESNTPALGPKLQRLVEAGCLPLQRAQELSPQQQSAIEQLTHGQIGTIIDAHERVGPVYNSQLI